MKLTIEALETMIVQLRNNERQTEQRFKLHQRNADVERNNLAMIRDELRDAEAALSGLLAEQSARDGVAAAEEVLDQWAKDGYIDPDIARGRALGTLATKQEA